MYESFQGICLYLPGGRRGMAPGGSLLLDVNAARSAVLDASAAASMSPGV